MKFIDKTYCLKNLDWYIGFPQDSGCCFVDEGGQVESTTLGRIASFYYLKYQTLSVFSERLEGNMDIEKVTPIPVQISLSSY